jgi:hypothetical protein
MTTPSPKRYRCLLCGRDKFQKPGSHYCRGQFLKHTKRKAHKLGLETIWEEIA